MHKIPCKKSFTETLLELAKKDKTIIALVSDSRGSVTLGDFADQLPEQFVECRIVEQDEVGITAGLAMCALSRVSEAQRLAKFFTFSIYRANFVMVLPDIDTHVDHNRHSYK